MPKEDVIITLACDDNYAKYASVVIDSIKNKSSGKRKYKIFVFHTNIKVSNIDKLQSMSSSLLKIECIDVSKEIENIKQYFLQNRYISVETYYRFLIPEILCEYKKVIYLDCDIICNANIENLYDIDIREHWIAGCFEPIELSVQSYNKNFLKVGDLSYFNAGILVFNIEKFVEFGVQQKCYNLMKEASDLNIHLLFADQDILNSICRKRVLYLEMCWNVRSYLRDGVDREPITDEHRLQITKSFKDSRIIHFAGAIKPWNQFELEDAELFWQIAINSIFYQEIVDAYIAYSIDFLTDRGYKISYAVSEVIIKKFIDIYYGNIQT